MDTLHPDSIPRMHLTSLPGPPRRDPPVYKLGFLLRVRCTARVRYGRAATPPHEICRPGSTPGNVGI